MSRRTRERHAPPPSTETLGPDDHQVAFGHRHDRLQQLITEELAALLRDELTDPALRPVGLAGADLSVDYRNVRVRFLVTSPAERAEADAVRAGAAFARAAGFLRHRLDEALDLKRVPDLHFHHDRDASAAHRAARILEGG